MKQSNNEMYYLDQLNKLDKSEFPIRIQLRTESTETHHLNLNTQSIPVLIEFLRELHSRYLERGDR